MWLSLLVVRSIQPIPEINLYSLKNVSLILILIIVFNLFPGNIIDESYNIRLGGSISNNAGFLQVGLPRDDNNEPEWRNFCFLPTSIQWLIVSFRRGVL